MNCLKCQLPLDGGLAHYGLHRDCFTAWFKVPPGTQFVSLTRHQAAESSDATLSNTSFFLGRFKKYSATLHEDAYILKMREDEAPELPAVEYLCNQIAEILDLPVAQFFMIILDEDNVFVTKNFIKQGRFSDLQHIHHFRTSNQHSCEDLIHIITEKTQRPYDIHIFIKMILFDALIGNHDRHGRNIGFIHSSDKMILAPIYDNVSYLSLEKGSMLKADFNPTGKISTKASLEPSMSDYIIELVRLGYVDAVYQFYKIVDMTKIEKLIETSFCSDLMKAALLRLIKKRYGEMQDELSET